MRYLAPKPLFVLKMDIRPAVKNDVDALKAILGTVELFPAELLEDMMRDYFENPSSEEVWITAVADGTPVAFGYCVPEKLTDGTCNLLAIAVHSGMQGTGVGRQLVAYIEQYLRQRHKRILIIETSGHAQYLPTQAFYHRLGYTLAATIPDFWKEGEDKIVFWKKL